MDTIDQKKNVLAYYNSTKWDYENLWFAGQNNYSVHFGFYTDKIKKHREALLQMNVEMSKCVNITKEDIVIDSGCGYGESALWLAKNIGCRTTGINIVPFQVAAAVKKAKVMGLESVASFKEDDFNETAFPDNSFSVYWALESLVHSSERLKTMQEAYRLLKTGGRIVIGEYLMRQNPNLAITEKQYMSPWLNGWAMPELLEPDEYVVLLEKAGFQKVTLHNISKNVAPSLVRLRQLCRNTIFLVKILGLFHKYNSDRLANLYGSQRQVQAFDKKLWDYYIITAEK